MYLMLHEAGHSPAVGDGPLWAEVDHDGLGASGRELARQDIGVENTFGI